MLSRLIDPVFQQLADAGESLDLVVETDSSAAQSMAQRRGLGKVRHIASELLWIQQKVYSGAGKVRKINGKSNTADLGTKHLSGPEIERHLTALGFRYA